MLQPPLFTNQYAAMPSLHAGWDLLVGMAIVAAASSVWLRAIGFILPMLMALAVVFTANHYILDVVAGDLAGAGGPCRRARPGALAPTTPSSPP